MGHLAGRQPSHGSLNSCRDYGNVPGIRYRCWGKQSAVVIGRSNIVGKPMAQLLQPKCDGDLDPFWTYHLAKIARKADILVVAIGRAKFVTADFVKRSSRHWYWGWTAMKMANMRRCRHDTVAPLASHITPVPGEWVLNHYYADDSRPTKAAVRALKKINQLGWSRDGVGA